MAAQSKRADGARQHLLSLLRSLRRDCSICSLLPLSAVIMSRRLFFSFSVLHHSNTCIIVMLKRGI